MFKVFNIILVVHLVFCLFGCGSEYISTAETYSLALSTSCDEEDSSVLSNTFQMDVPYLDQKYMHCGPASLSMVMEYYGIYATQEEIAEGIMGSNGTNTKALAKKAEYYEFKTYTGNCSLPGMLSLLSQGLPIMVRVINKNGSNGHFIIVTGYDTDLDLVYVNDPASPSKTFDTVEDFMADWDINSLGKKNSKNLLMVFYPKAPLQY